MKLRTPVLRTAAAILLTTAAATFAQTTATTDPVGFTTATMPASAGGNRTSSVTSFPLYRPAAYTATATAVGNSTVNLSGGNFGTGGGQTDVVTSPYLIRVKASSTAAHVGRFFLVSGQNADQLTTSSTTALTTFISVGDTCEVLPANTLGNIFGTTTVVSGWQTGATANVSDNLYIWNGSTWDIFFHNGTNWKKSSSLLNQNDTIIYPDEGVFISRLGTSPVSLVTMGAVPTTIEQTDLAGAGSTFVANRFPVDMQLGSIGFQQTPGWVSGATANSADKVYAWNGSTWDTYFYNGTNWKKSSSLQSQDTTIIPSGTALFVTRSAATGSTLVQNRPYSL